MVACVEEKAPVKVASRFAILADEDEELESEASPGLEMRKVAAPLVRKYSVCSVTQKIKNVKLEMAIDSGAHESVRPISLLKEIPTLKIVGKKKRFVAASARKWATTAAKR